MESCDLRPGSFHRLVSATVLLALVLALAPAAPAAATGVEVLPAGKKHFGLTYEELSSRWWKWALEEPAATNPVLDGSGAFCREGQSGRIWFLAGSFFGGDVERSCTIPKRRALFVPLVNCWADNSGAPGTAVPPTSFTEDELRGLIAGCVADAHDLLVEVDGEAVEHFAVQDGTRFSYRIPNDSVHDVLTGVDFPRQHVRGAVSNGYYTLLAPLPTGEHTIHIHGAIGGGFALDVVYHLTVR